MPRGHGRGRGGWRGGPGPQRILRFLEPCLLLLLRRQPSYGYSLLDELGRFGFTSGTVDASVVYRVLREMEGQGWVRSGWEVGGAGPPRRVYQMTPAGAEYLAWWIDDLKRTRDQIDRFVAAYEERGAH
jgi:PadR family transcriptional regulator PadR